MGDKDVVAVASAVVAQLPPIEPAERVRLKVLERLKDGTSTGKLLRYLHGQSKIAPHVRALVDVCALVEQGLEIFQNLADEGGELRASPVCDVDGVFDLVVSIAKVHKDGHVFLLKAREVIAKILEGDAVC
jgi:hypothetical protein